MQGLHYPLAGRIRFQLDRLQRPSPNCISMNCARRPWTKKQGMTVAHQIQFSGKACVNTVVANTCNPCSTVATAIAASELDTEK